MRILDGDTERVPLDALTPHPRNPRQGDVGAIHESIRANGFYGFVVAQRSTGYILAGNHRWQAAQYSGAQEVPVLWLDVDDDHATRILLADNRTNDLAAYSDPDLASLLQELRDNTGTLDGTGYADEDLDDLLRMLEADDNPYAPRDGVPLVDRFGAPPFSVLDARQGYWRARKMFWRDAGIHAVEGKEHLGSTVAQQDEINRGDTGGSTFDPVLAELAYRWHAPHPGMDVLDPFAGEGTKGIVAGMLGHQYTGVELRPEQVKANVTQWQRVRANLRTDTPAVAPQWLVGDSANLDDVLPDGQQYDLLFTSPPYFDLEVYSRSDLDGSAFESYDVFVPWLTSILHACVDRLRDNRFAVVKIGVVRNRTTTAYHDLVSDTIRALQDTGMAYYNEAVLLTPIGNMGLRASAQFPSTRKLTKGHQNVLVFYKGDPRDIGDMYPRDVPLMDVLPDDGDDA